MDNNKSKTTIRSSKDIKKDIERMRTQKKLLDDFMNKMGWNK